MMVASINQNAGCPNMISPCIKGNALFSHLATSMRPLSGARGFAIRGGTSCKQETGKKLIEIHKIRL